MTHNSLRGVIAGACMVAAVASCDEPEYDVLSPDASARENFATPLTGAAERPTPVTTTATGSFGAQIRDLSATAGAVRYELFVQNIDSVTASHIHAGDPNAAGPVMVFLFSATPATGSGVSGLLRQGDITRQSAFTAPYTFDSLITLLRNGTAYVNVHTRRFPGGEIRGQIATADGFPF